MICKNCGHTKFERDLSNANNDLVCAGCGVVSEDNPIVSEVTFGETSSGAAVVQGAFIGAGQAHASFQGAPFGSRGALESREQTLNNARRKIRAVAIALRIPEYVSDAAFQWYKLALTNNFVQGRRSQNVIASCLYVACRKEKTHHMLIDFSSRLQVSVYSVGATFLKMVKALHITDLPLADPSIFIQHFSEKLDLGDKKIKVTRDAVRLAQRMSDDWIHEGRRPAGIAGACLLLACRMNNLRRTHSEIVAVSHIAEETLQRRLDEFKQTASGSFTIKEFREIEQHGTAEKPPSFQKNRKKEKQIRAQLAAQEGATEEDETRKALDENSALGQVFVKEQVVSSKELMFHLKRFNERRQKDIERIKGTHGIRDVEVEESVDGYSLETDPDRPKNFHLLPKTNDLLGKVGDDPENLSDVDDMELDGILLNEEESKLKERIWIGLNGDFLLEQESKRLKAEADVLSGNTTLKKKRKTKKKDEIASDLVDAINAAKELGENPDMEDITAANSVKNMLAKSSFSKKINYEAIDGLFDQK